MLSNVRNDIRYALRTLRHNPGFALAAIVPIALGIGINTALFSLLNSVAWRPLPVPDPEALVSSLSGLPWRAAANGARCAQSALDPRIPRLSRRGAHAHGADGLLERVDSHAGSRIRAGDRRHPRHVQLLRGAQIVAGHRHRLHACQLRHAGRAARRGVESRALADRLRQRSARSSTNRFVLNGRDVTVVGVAAAGFDGVDMAKAAFFAPTSMVGVFQPEQNFHENAHVSWLTLVGRRRDDATAGAGAGRSLGDRRAASISSNRAARPR